MNEHDDDTRRMNRRRALQLLGAGITAATGLVALAGTAASAAEAASCKTKVPLDATATQMRRTLQYVEKSNQAGKKCGSCAHFLAGKYQECGGCKLFGGAVNPNGVCLSWAPKAA